MWRQLDNPQYTPLYTGFSLLELMLVLALRSVLVWIAVPRYVAQQVQGRSAAMQLELMASAQALHALRFPQARGTNTLGLCWPLLAFAGRCRRRPRLRLRRDSKHELRHQLQYAKGFHHHRGR